MTGDQGNKWIKGTVDIGLQGDFFLVMEAIMKDGFQGDIAIDDITFVNCAIGENGRNQNIPLILQKILLFDTKHFNFAFNFSSMA